MPGYDFDLVRGARYDIDLRQPVGSRIRNLAVRGRLLTAIVKLSDGATGRAFTRISSTWPWS